MSRILVAIQTKVTLIAKVIERGTVRLTEQQDFVPPEPLPLGWQYAKERNEQVIRLDHKMYETDKSENYDLDVLKKSDGSGYVGCNAVCEKVDCSG